ncbi:MAG: HAMP domain-containing sensor histidine kinase [Candidatus Parcubacteria bacterium]|nr:HAMP domain-containing sensor histidine kinase [Candidatus Parcubacteria bacterium]
MENSTVQKQKVAEVVSVAAHQLKNPLSVIKGYLEILVSGDFGRINKKQKEYLDDALENVGRMRKIINSLLDVAKIEENKYEMKKQPFKLEDIIESVVNDFSYWVKAYNCKIIFEKPDNTPEAFGDNLKIRQVIENLISNALKYKTSGEGKIEIGISQNEKEIIVSFKDNGIGIKEEDMDKMFSKFYRSEEAMEKDPEGNGLGLYIDKAIIELNGGKLWFKNNEDSGVTFFFTIPINAKN